VSGPRCAHRSHARGRALTEDDLVVRTEIAVVGDLVSACPDLTVREHPQLVAVAHGAGGGAGSLVDRALRECRLDDHDSWPHRSPTMSWC
jgi:ABC-2 type transport system ATP-binding protein